MKQKRLILGSIIASSIALFFIISTQELKAQSVGSRSPRGCTWHSNGEMMVCPNRPVAVQVCASGGEAVHFSDGWGFGPCGTVTPDCETHGFILISDCGEILCGNGRYDAGGGGGGGGGGECTTKTITGSNSCSYWDTVDWKPCDLTTGTQQAIQVLRTKSCTWSCTCEDCGSGCSCSSSCNPGCPPNDPKVRNCDVCGDNMVPEPMRKYWDKRGRCPGITPAYPRPGADDVGWTRDRAYQSEDPWDENGLLKPIDQYQCNVNDYTYLELICEECDHGFCGSATCFGPADGAAYACRWKAGNCRDGVVQHDEVCDGDHCNSTCTAWASCGDGEINWPPNRNDKEQCDDGKSCHNSSGQLINCTTSTSGCANVSDCIARRGDGCDNQCRQENQGNQQEVLPD